MPSQEHMLQTLETYRQRFAEVYAKIDILNQIIAEREQTIADMHNSAQAAIESAENPRVYKVIEMGPRGKNLHRQLSIVRVERKAPGLEVWVSR